MKREDFFDAVATIEAAGVPRCNAVIAAKELGKKGFRPERRSEWVRDETYPGKNKDIYRCRACDHYESIRKGDNKLRYMNYCPDCGALMRGDRSENEEESEE